MTTRRTKEWGPIGLACALGCALSCSTHASEPVAVVQSALQMSVSAALDVEPLPALHARPPLPAAPRITCTDSLCLVTYTDCFAEDYDYSAKYCYIYGSRLAPNGQWLDARPIYIGTGSPNAGAYNVGTNGKDEFLVVWVEDNTKYFRARINAADGTFSEPPTVNAGDPGTAIVSDGSSYLIVYGASARSVRLLKGSVLSPAIPVPAPASSVYGDIAAMSGPSGSYLLAWVDFGSHGLASRFDVATQAFLDSPAFTYTKFNAQPPRGVYVGGVYMLAWGSATVLRIGTDGTVLDPDDEFNGITGAKTLQTRTGDSTAIFAKDGKAVVLWRDQPLYSPKGVYGIRVDPATAAIPPGDPAPFTVLSDIGSEIHVGLGAQSGVLVSMYPNEAQNIIPITWNASPFGINTSAAVPFAYEADDRGVPSAASNGASFLVAWAVGSTIVAERLDESTGARLDTSPLNLATIGYQPTLAVTSDGTDYLVTWEQDGKLFDRVVHANGSLGPASSSPLYQTSGVIASLRGVYNGAYHWLAWNETGSSALGGGVETMRIDPTTLTPSAAVNSAIFPAGPESFDLCADTAPVASMRTVLVATAESATAVRAARVRSASDLVQPRTTLLGGPATANSVHLSSDGSQFFAVWTSTHQLAEATVAGALVDPVSGLPLSGYPKELLTVPPVNGYSVQHAYYDGRSHVVLLSARGGLLARRFSSTLDSLDAADTVVLPFFDDFVQEVATATSHAGHSLLAYLAGDPQRAGFAVKVRVLDNDGLAWAGPYAGGAGASGMAGGGAGGVAGLASGDAAAASGGAAGLASAGVAGVAAAGGARPGVTGGGDAGTSSPSGGDSEGGDQSIGGSGGASVGPTAGASGSSGNSGGCGCRLATTSGGGRAWLLGLLFLGALRRRQRDRAR